MKHPTMKKLTSYNLQSIKSRRLRNNRLIHLLHQILNGELDFNILICYKLLEDNRKEPNIDTSLNSVQLHSKVCSKKDMVQRNISQKKICKL